MVRKLHNQGGNFALVIDRTMLELLNITPETPLAVQTDGRSLIISPDVDPKRQVRFEAALARVNEHFGGALRRLAE